MVSFPISAMQPRCPSVWWSHEFADASTEGVFTQPSGKSQWQAEQGRLTISMVIGYWICSCACLLARRSRNMRFAFVARAANGGNGGALYLAGSGRTDVTGCSFAGNQVPASRRPAYFAMTCAAELQGFVLQLHLDTDLKKSQGPRRPDTSREQA